MINQQMQIWWMAQNLLRWIYYNKNGTEQTGYIQSKKDAPF